MKKFILPNDVNWYRANMHCHTRISDGYFTPEQIKEEYKKMGYSVVAYSDHELIRDRSDLSDADFLAITSSEFSVDDTASSFSLPEGKSTDIWRTHAEFTLDREDIMFRITVRDEYGNNAHTHYYRVEDYLS